MKTTRAVKAGLRRDRMRVNFFSAFHLTDLTIYASRTLEQRGNTGGIYSLLRLYSRRLGFPSAVERCNSVPLLSFKLFLYYRPNKHLTPLYYHCYYHRAITSTSMKCCNQEGPWALVSRGKRAQIEFFLNERRSSLQSRPHPHPPPTFSRFCQTRHKPVASMLLFI